MLCKERRHLLIESEENVSRESLTGLLCAIVNSFMKAERR